VNPRTILGEPGARRVSPFLFVLVILCFFLAFAGVSCNTDAAKVGLGAIAGSAGVSAPDANALDTCLDSLKGENIVSYSGWVLVLGRDPTIASLPAACDTGTAVTASDASQVNIGSQLLAILGLVAIGLALLCAVAGFFGVARGRSRAFATVIFAAGSGVLLVLDQLHVHDILLSKIAASAGSSVPGFDPTTYFNINFGIGLLIALVLLALAVVYNIVAMIAGDVPAAPGVPAIPEPPPI
jgi:hypothetical protein